MNTLTIELMQELQSRIKVFLENYKGNIEAPISLETRNALKYAINATETEEFQATVRQILPHQLGVLAVNYGIELYF